MKRKTIAAVCMAAGLVALSVPFFFSLYGGMRNQEFLEEIGRSVLESTGQGEKPEVRPDEMEKGIAREGDAIGMIEIEALGLKYPVLEGTGSSELCAGIGHIPDTAGIGRQGNCVLAGHRGSRYGTYFKYLDRINVGDEIRLTDKEGKVYLYEAAGMKVVGPYDNSVKDQNEEKELTLLTCEDGGTMRLIVSCTWRGKEE